MKQFKSLTLFSLVLISVYLSSCKSDPSPATPPPTGISVVANSSLGSVLTDNKNQTLYFFASDAAGIPTCTGACEKYWPVFYVENPTLDGQLSSTDFAVITRSDGKKQSTYKGFPLYYFSPTGDGKLEKAGETNGDGVDNVWFAAKLNYTIMISSEQLVGADGKNYTSASVEGSEINSFFTDGNGRTLYVFSNDTQNNNNFTAADLSNNTIWPMFYATLGDLPTGVTRSDFSEITVFGQKQLTYKGRPLYYFGGNTATVGDHNRGETRGISFPSPGIWHTVNNATTAAPTSITTTQNATLGTLITDSKGRTLYMFTKDTDGSNHFCPTGQCTTVKWPAFYSDLITVPNTLQASDFATINVAGTKQTTYKGWPLYYYAPAGDGVIEAAGSIGGDGFGASATSSALWYAAKSYSIMVANAQLKGVDGNQYVGESVPGPGATFYFVDGNGRTIYRFNNDHSNTDTFTNGTATHDAPWPLFYTPAANLVLPSSINRADFGEITVFGQKQLTYKGWPLYYFNGNGTNGDASDPAVRGKTGGVSVGSTATTAGPWRIVFTSTTIAP
ncbi:hypothetical protein WSM22_36550 [Cytophagales bacterium WSM2-2]|nr:hypothetical protein WSM22_36550 [Cytophagales bacterium WSM2-2]